MTSVSSEFRSAIRQFEKAGSASGSKISKSEMQKALETLQKDGKVTAAERNAAKDLLDSAKLTKGAKDVLQAFVDGNTHHIGGDTNLKPAARDAILSQFSKLERQGTIEWKNRAGAFPMGQAFHTEPLRSQNFPDGINLSVMIPTGALSPTAPQKDPNTVATFYIHRSGGIAGFDQVAGPFTRDELKPSRGGLGAQIDNTSSTSNKGKVSEKLADQIRSVFGQHMNADYHGRDILPVGVQFVTHNITAQKHPDGYSWNALIPAGALAPGVKPDISKAKEFYVERSGGFAGIKQYAGPFSLKAGGDVDGPNIHPPSPDLGKVSAGTLAKMQKALEKAVSSGKLHWTPGESLPMGPRYTRQLLSRENHPDGFQFTAMIPSGALNPRFPAGDPNKATSFFVVRSGGFAGRTETAGPIEIK